MRGKKVRINSDTDCNGTSAQKETARTSLQRRIIVFEFRTEARDAVIWRINEEEGEGHWNLHIASADWCHEIGETYIQLLRNKYL